MEDALGMHVIERVNELGGVVSRALERERPEARYSRLQFTVLCEIEDVNCE